MPRALGDHGATPPAAYLVLTTAAVTRGPNPRFLSPAEVISLATEWRLPLNEVWYFPDSAAPRVEAALHAARWTLKDSQVDALLGQAASSSSSPDPAAAASATVVQEEKGIKQGFLTHLETQGEVLEGFVLMALEVGDLSGLQQLVTTYNRTMAPWHDAARKQALELGRQCHHRDARLETLLGDNGGSGGMSSAGVMLDRGGLTHGSTTALVGDDGTPKPVPAPEPQRVSMAAADLWPLVCQASGDVGGLFKRLRSSYQHRIVLKAYRYTTLASLAAAAASSSSGAEGGGGATEVFQVQVEIHDDEVFYSWPLHARAGGCSPLYRGMVVQFDGHLDEESRRLEDGIKGLGLANDSPLSESSSSLSQGSVAGVLEMRILGIAKLKCLNYLWRTFGVRNQLPTLLGEGEAAYVRRCQTGFFKNWSIPQEHRGPLLALFTGWGQFVKTCCSAKDRDGLKGRSMYLDLLEQYLNSGHQGALQAAHLVSGVGVGTTIGGGGGANTASASPSSPLAPFYTVVANLTGSDLSPGMLQSLGLTSLKQLESPPVGLDPSPGCWLECKSTLPSVKQLGDLRGPGSGGGNGGNGGSASKKSGKSGGMIGVSAGGAPRVVIALGPSPNQQASTSSSTAGRSEKDPLERERGMFSNLAMPESKEGSWRRFERLTCFCI